MNIVEAINDAALFKPWFRDPGTWTSWFAFLKALFGLDMNKEERQVFRQCTGRGKAPETPTTEAWLVAGRRAGKSFIAALVAVFLSCFEDYSAHLAPGERGTVMIIAADKRQARVILGYVKALLEGVPMLARLVDRQTAEGIELSNRIVIEVHAASFRSVRGYTVVACLCDEISFWRSEDCASPDVEVINAVRPAMSTIPGALLIGLSSPYARRGVLWNAYREHHGKENPGVLVWQAPSQIMNPCVPQKVLDEAYQRDPASAAAEFGAEFRRDIEAFISFEIVEGCVVAGRHELPPVNGIAYRAFVDPSGGSQDSMTLAVAHNERGTVVLDCIRERKPPFSPEAVVKEFCDLLKSYHVSRVTGDRFGGEWPRERFKEYGITYAPSEKSKSDLYAEALPLLNGGKVQLLDSKKLATQLTGLERRTSRSGKDSIDHGPGAHDDVANAAAGALYLCRGGTALSGEISTGGSSVMSEAFREGVFEDRGPSPWADSVTDRGYH